MPGSDERQSVQQCASPARYTRRLSDHVLIAFHHACDQGDIEAARRLLDVLEFMVRRPPRVPGGRERRAKESLVAAHERLWHIQHGGSRLARLGIAQVWGDDLDSL
jgi:hypothetical protein